MRRKILMGALALALPAGLVAVSQTAAFAHPNPNPISCTGINASVVFGGTITNEGNVTTVHKPGPSTSVTANTFSCGGGSNNASTPLLSIAGGKNAKNPNLNKKACKTDPTNTAICDKYVENTWAEFAAAGTGLKKSLKTLPVTINGYTDTVKVKGSVEIIGSPCGAGEVGFQINGQDKGHYYDKTTSLLVCLHNDLRANNTVGVFGADLFTDNGGGVLSAQIDPATSKATL